MLKSVRRLKSFSKGVLGLMSKYLKIALVVLFGFTAAACEGNKQTIGAVGGAVAGAAVGSAIGQGSGRTAAMLIGAAIGAYIGSEIGKRLDERDRALARQNAVRAMREEEVGTTSRWENPETGHSGTATPLEPVAERSDGTVCQIQEHEIEADGESDTMKVRVCDHPDGSSTIERV
jgi:surface antigen